MIDPKSKLGTYLHGSEDLDVMFGRLVPQELRHLSALHWTPAKIVVRATNLLRPTKQTCVLDVGSGVGKVCTLGALSGSGVWVGVEQHAALVDSAVEVARILDVTHRTRFLRADAFSLDWNDFDVLYFYNPFELQLSSETNGVSPSLQVARVEERLAGLPNYTRVVTLRGFGGVMPSSFELLYHEHVHSVRLELSVWIQRPRRVVGLS